MSGWQTYPAGQAPVRHWSYASALATRDPINIIPSWADPLAQFHDNEHWTLLWTDGYTHDIQHPLSSLPTLHPAWLSLLVNLHHHPLDLEKPGEDAYHPSNGDEPHERSGLRQILVLEIGRGHLPEVPSFTPGPDLHGYPTQTLDAGDIEGESPRSPYLLITHGDRSCFFQTQGRPAPKGWLDYTLKYSLSEQLHSIFGGRA